MTQTARTLKANVVTHCSKKEDFAIVPQKEAQVGQKAGGRRMAWQSATSQDWVCE